MSRLHLLAYASLCIIWGSTWLGIAIVVQYVPPFLAAALRFFLAAILLFIWMLFRKPAWPRDPRQWNAILVLGFTVIAIPYGLLFWAEQYVASSLSAVLFSALPLMVAMFTPSMMKMAVPRRAVMAMEIAFGGILVLLYTGLQLGTRVFVAALLILVAMTCSAWSIVYAKIRLEGLDPIVSTALQLLTGSVGLFWATWALESHRHATWNRSAILVLVLLATLGSAATFAIYYWLLQKMQPYQLSTINLVIPVAAVIEGAAFHREPVPLMMIVAMAVVLGSVAVALRAEAETEPQSITIADRP